ncbi:MAG: gas vesicle protein [Chloroflexi bacterium]|nr:gas vesicle protein [Chloroflexota bacterium]
MNASEVLERAREEFVKLGKKPADGVTGLSKTDGGWSILLEALERKAIPDTMDVLGLYELHLDDEGNLLGLDRKKLRKRGETREE